MTKIASLPYDTCGVGNRLFQYIYGRLFCEDQGYILSHAGIPELNISGHNAGTGKNIYQPQRFLQDYNLYRSYLERIKSWDCFTPIKEENKNDLVVHLRAGNRFLGKNANYTAGS